MFKRLSSGPDDVSEREIEVIEAFTLSAYNNVRPGSDWTYVRYDQLVHGTADTFRALLHIALYTNRYLI